MILGKQVSWINTSFSEKWKLTPKELERALEEDNIQMGNTSASQPRILIFNYPCNPTGLTYTPEELEAIAKVARKFGVILLSDEIYGGIPFVTI